MKPSTLLLIASLLTNVALVAVHLTGSPSSRATHSAAGSAKAATAREQTTPDALRAALASGDAATLQAAGIPPDVARELALGRAFSKIAERVRAAQTKTTTDNRWWRNRTGAPGSGEQQLLARRELSDALVAAFGNDLGLGGGDSSQFAFLDPAKRDALRRIIQDYDEMMAKFGAGGVQLASDKEKLRLLRAERDRDIAALLSPDERLAYEMRTSPSGSTVRNRYGDAIESEAEFQKIYALQKAFDDNFPREALTGRITPEVMRARGDAERQLDSDLRTAVGDDRYAALRRATDPDLRTLDSLVARLNLPATTSNNVLATRDSFAAESQRINGDASIPFPQRRTQIQDLASRAKAEVGRALGNEAGEAYAQNSQWLNMLQSGLAYSTTPPTSSAGSMSIMGGTQSVYPVMPAGTGGPGGARQMIFTAATPVEGGVVGDRVMTNSNMQVMTFSHAPDPAGTPATTSAKPIVVVPGQPAQPTPPPKQ